MKEQITKWTILIAGAIGLVVSTFAVDTINYIVDPVTGEYCGTGYKISVSVSKPASGAIVQFSETGEDGTWVDEATFAGYKNVCTDKPIHFKITATGYATVTGSANVTITPKTLTEDYVWGVYPPEGYTYDGTEKKPGSTIGEGPDLIITTDDYMVSYENNINAGEDTAKVIFTGKNNFTGSCEETFSIAKAKINDDEEPGGGSVPAGGVSKFDVTAEYDGRGHTIDTNAIVQAFAPTIIGTFTLRFMDDESGAIGDRALPPLVTNVCTTSVWYEVSAPNYVDYVHEAKVTITPRDIAAVTIDPIPNQTETGAAIEPVPVVTDGNPSIVKTSDYEASYADNVSPGTATLTLTGKNNYTGTKSTTFVIVSGAKTYAIFDAIGGAIGDDNIVSQEVTTIYGSLPVAVRSGYALDGWYLGVTNGAPKATDNGSVLTSGNHTLYAKWSYDPAVTPDPDTIYKWEAIDDNTARIVGFKNVAQQLTTMVMPDRIGNRFVTEIGAAAFANSTCGATKLLLPMFCTTIGDKAFLNMPSLAEITFADTRNWSSPSSMALLNIGKYAFSGATGLTSLSLGDAVGTIGNYAFLNTRKLSSITILGKPTVGTQVFRSAGLNVSGITVHLDPALAGDSAYMASLKAGMNNVTVKTDAIVKKLTLTTLKVASNAIRLTVAAETAKSWNGVDTSGLRVKYRSSLADEPVTLTPTSAIRNDDGSVTLEVDLPHGSSGFFQTILEN